MNQNRHLFFLSELSSQAWWRSSVSPGIITVPANGLHIKHSDGTWSILLGFTTVGEENGTIVGIIDHGRILPIYDQLSNVINIQLLGLRRIELSSDEAREFQFGRRFQRTIRVNFILNPN